MFNTGQNKFVAQFTQSQKNVANYLQRTSDEGYLVAQTVWTGKKQIIELPAAVDSNSSTAADNELIRQELVKAMGKRRMKLSKSLLKGYATVYRQCSDKVKEKLEASSNWQHIQDKQSLHKLIQKIKRVCIGFDDHKQEVYNWCSPSRCCSCTPRTRSTPSRSMGRNSGVCGTPTKGSVGHLDYTRG
jgi:hypothetical protein